MAVVPVAALLVRQRTADLENNSGPLIYRLSLARRFSGS
jgi:hypothetical protein